MTNQVSTLQSIQPTICSLDIATLLNARHDSVKKTIERLIESGTISLPPLVDGVNSASGCIPLHYDISKRDSYVVVAHLSPTFTAALFDAWQEFEAKQSFEIPQKLSEALRLSADLADKVQEQAAALAVTAPKVEFYNTIMDSSALCQLGIAVQVAGLPFGRDTLFQKLRADGVLISAGERHNLPKQSYIERGLFSVKEKTFDHPTTGETFVKFTTYCTQKGIDWLIKTYSKESTSLSEKV
jgi:anti-repressor protein